MDKKISVSKFIKKITFPKILAVLGIVILVFFSVKLLKSVTRLYRSQNAPINVQELDIRGWMTLPGISRKIQVPEEILFEELGVPLSEANRKKSVKTITDEFFNGDSTKFQMSLDEIISKHNQLNQELRP